ncbi:TPA: hypothetical protein ACKP1B_004165 [Serratia fonticola]
MEWRTLGEVCCFSCPFKCDLVGKPTIKMATCASNKYCVWPDNNFYLKLGIEASIISSDHNYLHEGFVYVDFSCRNLKLFTNRAWLDNLEKTQLKIILISDKSMQPLALYWKKRSSEIVSIVNLDGTKAEIDMGLLYPSRYHKGLKVEHGKLNDAEVKVLDLMFNVKTIEQISKILDINLKKTYGIKRLLQQKMGGKGRLHTIISR